MVVKDVLVALVAGSASGGAVLLLFRVWIEARLKASIQHEYNERLELFKKQLEERSKIALVADLLSQWISIPKGDPIPKEQRTELNRLSFEATLWLPSDLAVELSKTIQLKAGAKSIFDLLLLARKVLTGDSELQNAHVTYWGHDIESRGQPVIATER